MDYRKRFGKRGLGDQQRRVGTIVPPAPKRPPGSFDYLELLEDAQTVRILPGEYKQEMYDAETGEVVEEVLDFLRVDKHWDASEKKYLVCSEGTGYDLKPCVGCSKGLRKSPVSVFTVILLEHMHKAPWEKGGKIQMRDGKPILIDKPCEGKNCPLCNMDIERFFGKRLHWSLSSTHFDQIIQEENKIKGTCECGKVLCVESFGCPVCGKVLLDFESTDMSDKAIRDAFANGMWCETCKRPVLVVETVDCPKSEGGCGNPRPLSILKVNMTVKKVPVPRSNNYNLDITLSAPCDIPEDYKGEVKPMDLIEINKPLPVRQQRELLRYMGPITNVEEKTEQYVEGDKSS